MTPQFAGCREPASRHPAYMLQLHESFMKEGTQKEAEAKKAYILTLQKEGHSADIEDCGLTIFRELPILGPSPDGVVKFSCECCKHTVRLLEVKCRQQTKNKPLSQDKVENFWDSTAVVRLQQTLYTTAVRTDSPPIVLLQCSAQSCKRQHRG